MYHDITCPKCQFNFLIHSVYLKKMKKTRREQLEDDMDSASDEGWEDLKS